MRSAAVLSLLAVVLLLPPAPARAAEDTEATLLKTLGYTTAAYLMELHDKVGVLADARAKKVYDLDTCEKKIDITINLLKGADRQMGDLLKSDIAASEKRFVRSVRSIIAKEIKSAEALKAYWSSRDVDDLDTYQTNREEAWNELRKLIGADKAPGSDRTPGSTRPKD